MVNIIINGKEISVKDGITILEAADEAGIEIPHLCYHKALSIPANCRMCLVETNKSAKLVPSCYERVSNGLVIKTESERVKELRKAILEFILINHPLDCPICDKAGECHLQDLYFKYSTSPSRFFMSKLHKVKTKNLGKNVIYDAERCILCTRCVRFFQEILKDPQLTVIHRGEDSEIGTFSGKEISNPYSMNVVDLCPVGALTSMDFRFKCRVWFLKRKKSICLQCARGCNIFVDSFREKIQRFVPKENQSVNKLWICDEGRLSFHEYEKKRILNFIVKENGWTRVVDEDEVVYKTHKELKSHIEKYGKGSVIIVASPYLTLEDASVISKFSKEFLFSSNIVIGGKEDGYEDNFLIKSDKNPNKNGLKQVFTSHNLNIISKEEFFKKIEEENIKGIIVIGFENESIKKVYDLREKIEFLCVIASNNFKICEIADILIPAPIPYEKEGSFVNCSSGIQSVEKCVNPPSKEIKPEREFLKNIASKDGIKLE